MDSIAVRPLKLLVFAHRPPPLHGQSYMVGVMLDGFARRPELGVACHHIDARVSAELADVGQAGTRKVFRLLRHVRDARQLARTQNVDAFFYVPAPGQRTPLYRDWLALPRLRSVMPRSIFCWHAAGLGDWLRQSARSWERAVTLRTHGRHSLSLVHSPRSDPGLTDLLPGDVRSVPNGIPDPRENAETPARNPIPGRLLFLGLCCEEKGLFVALETLAAMNRAEPGKYHLDVGGGFPDALTRARFDARVAESDLRGTVSYHGFANSESKARLWSQAAAFLFPTFYGAESMPLVLLEAMAWGVPIVTTRWRALPDFLPSGYCGLVEPHKPEATAHAVRKTLNADVGLGLRRHFEQEFTLNRHLEKLAAACRSVRPRERE